LNERSSSGAGHGETSGKPGPGLQGRGNAHSGQPCPGI
jgi:hypothetical protein